MTCDALILAAGLGTRLLPYTALTPKPMFTMAGRPLLHHWIMRLAKAGCRQIFVNTHHLHAEIEAYIACNHWPVPVQTFFEPVILGTGGAIKNVEPSWNPHRPLMVVNADITCNYDLKALLAQYNARQSHALLLLTRDARFNTVSLNHKGGITGFKAKNDPQSFTFTGIQVISRAATNYIPADVFYGSIEAYEAMIKDGLKVDGLVDADCGWQDIGDVERYNAAAFKACARKAFGKTFNDNGEITVNPLQGDGSDRKWYRLQTDHNSIIACDHGLTPPLDADKTTEAQAFINIGRHLNAKDLPVAQIYFHDAFRGLVFLQDLGAQNLQSYVAEAPDKESVIAVYKKVIDALLEFSQTGVKGFNPGWAWQTPSYNCQVVLNLECGYFMQRFVREYLEIDAGSFNLQPEFEHLADEIGRWGFLGLMHRDFQSRNIMVQNHRPYFIDYQAARLGPLQYDLASLLFDPYTDLDEDLRNLLLNYCLNHKKTAGFKNKIENGFYYCGLSRTMQALGAYAFLSGVKGKAWFRPYMRPALNNLNRLLNSARFNNFTALGALGALCNQKLKQKTP